MSGIGRAWAVDLLALDNNLPTQRILCWEESMAQLSRRMAMLVILCSLLSVTAGWAAGQDKPPGIEGTWQGTLDLGVAKLRLVAEIAKKDGGGLTGKLDSPDQLV